MRRHLFKYEIIPTLYKGYRFRSRLEARWAVFFDHMGIRYEYEPEGFRFEDGFSYLPDFRIYVQRRLYPEEPAGPVYVEVKGRMKIGDMAKVEDLADHFPVLLLGDIPADSREYFDTFDLRDGFHSYRYIDGDEYPVAFSVYNDEVWLCGPDHDEWDGGNAMDSALIAARSARFEYCETP